VFPQSGKRMDAPQFELYVLNRPVPPAWLKRTIDSAAQWLDPKPSRILMVGQCGEANMLDARGAVGFASADIPVLKTLPADRRDETFRHFFRLAVSKFVKTPAYMVMNAGSALFSPCKVFGNGQYLLRRESLFHFPDYRMHNWLFGKYPLPGGWFLPSAMLFDREIVAEIMALVERRYGLRWFDAVLNILNGVPDTRFNAAQVYGGYLETFHGQTMRSVESDHLRVTTETEPGYSAPVITLNSEDPTPPATDSRVLRMSTLGVNGRFGNQVFQYAFLRLFAKEHGMEAQNPPWIGSTLFGHSDRFSTDPLPLWCENNGELPREMSQCGPRPSSHEIWGHFQQHTSVHQPRHAEFRELFKPIESIRAPLEEAITSLRAGGTLIGLHLRRGDYVGGYFWPAPTEWYLRWLDEIWPTLHKPVLYIASDEVEKVAGDFRAFMPKMAGDLKVNLKGAEFYPDFFALSRCDWLAISNSTFSYATAMLNETAKGFMRPDPDRRKLIEFDPWNAMPLLMAKKMAA
jgi:hypothetical protein